MLQKACIIKGMIYMEPSQLGWRPLKDSYMQYELPAGLSAADRELVNDLFEWLVDPCLEFLRAKCKLLVHTTPLHLVRSIMRLYTCLLDEVRAASALLAAQAAGTAAVLSDEEKEEKAAAAAATTAGGATAAPPPAPGAEGSEPLTPQQITLWLQGLFLFSLVWGIAGVLVGIHYF